MSFRLLIVDDEAMVRSSLCRSLKRPDCEIRAVEGVAEARRTLEDEEFDLVLADYRLGDGTGMEVLADARRLRPDTEVILLTAHGNIQLAVKAMREGAFDFLEKGSEPELTRIVVGRALDQVRLRREVEALGGRDRRRIEGIVAESDAMRKVLATARDYAATDVTVLLRGETGTGKSLVAELIHHVSPRASGPLVTLNCGAIPKELIESELFGYEEGAFTGAARSGKMGLVEQAHGGTLFLDEIGDLHLDLQSKLLLVLERGEILRVGAVQPRIVDVRFLAASNVDLEQRMADKGFRRDLYYRLEVAPLGIPPLRERESDVLPLARRFLVELARKLNRPVPTLAPDAENALRSHSWPGNIRELRNALERAVLLSRRESLEAADLRLGPAGPREDPLELSLRLGRGDGNLLQEAVHRLVERAWEVSGHNQSQAAELLGLPRTTLQHHLRKQRLI